MLCRFCNKEIVSRNVFCNIKCQNEFYYKKYIQAWLENKVSGGSASGTVSNHVRRYLFEKFKNRCSKCDWSEINKKSEKIPLQAEHIDGNSSNHKEENLTLLCPNCHSLTDTYGALNKGYGRKNRTR